MANSIEEVKKSVKTFYLIGGVLFILTAITYWIAYVDLGTHVINTTVGLLIALFKACLVGAIFMHMKGERGLIYKFLVFTVVFFAAMMFLFVLAAQDPLHFSLFKHRQ
jgi:cytochrome c oxidase subunit IV